MTISSQRLLSRKTTIGVCSEATPGTSPTVAADKWGWFPCYELSFTPEVGFIERDLLTESLAPENTDAIGTQFARVTFKCDVSGSTTTPAETRIDPTGGLEWETGTPEWMLALRGCGFFNYWPGWENFETNSTRFGTATTWNVMLPSNTPPQASDSASTLGDAKDKQTTITIKFWQDERLYTITGCMGNVTFGGTAGDLLYANFEFLGVLNSVDAGEVNPSGAYDMATPTPLSRTDKTCWSVNLDKTPPTSSWELNMGNAYDIYKDVNVDKAGSYACIYESKPTLNITTLSYDTDTTSELLASRMLEVTTGTFQAVAGVTGTTTTTGTPVQQFLFGIPVTEITSIDVGEETGYLVANATCKVVSNYGLNDEEGIMTAPDSRSLWLAYGAEVETAFLSDGNIDDPTDQVA